MIYSINIILFVVVIYFVYKNYTLTKKKVIEEVDKDWLRLPIPKYETPKWDLCRIYGKPIFVSNFVY